MTHNFSKNDSEKDLKIKETALQLFCTGKYETRQDALLKAIELSKPKPIKDPKIVWE